MDCRVEGLDPPIENLRKSGHIGHRDRGNAVLPQRTQSSSSGENLPAQIDELAGEFHDSRLVIDTDERTHEEQVSFPTSPTVDWW